MNTLGPPISPTHVASAIATVLALALPHINPVVRVIIILIILLLLLIGEVLYTYITKHRLQLPDLSAEDKALLSDLAKYGESVAAGKAPPHPDPVIAQLEHPTAAMEAEAFNDTNTEIQLAERRLQQLRAR